MAGMVPAMASDGGREVHGHGGARRPRSGAGGESERVPEGARARDYGGAGARQWQGTQQRRAAMVEASSRMAATHWTRAAL